MQHTVYLMESHKLTEFDLALVFKIATFSLLNELITVITHVSKIITLHFLIIKK